MWAFVEHGFAKYRATALGSLHAASASDPDNPEFQALLKGKPDDIVDSMRQPRGEFPADFLSA